MFLRPSALFPLLPDSHANYSERFGILVILKGFDHAILQPKKMIENHSRSAVLCEDKEKCIFDGNV
jgi:hypothetical protein